MLWSEPERSEERGKGWALPSQVEIDPQTRMIRRLRGFARHLRKMRERGGRVDTAPLDINVLHQRPQRRRKQYVIELLPRRVRPRPVRPRKTLVGRVRHHVS